MMPIGDLTRYLNSSQWTPKSNRAHYNNATVDKLLNDAKVEVDETKRADLYKQAEKTIMDEAPWLFLYYPKQVVAYRSNISGFQVLPTEHLLLEDVVKK